MCGALDLQLEDRQTSKSLTAAGRAADEQAAGRGGARGGQRGAAAMVQQRQQPRQRRAAKLGRPGLPKLHVLTVGIAPPLPLRSAAVASPAAPGTALCGRPGAAPATQSSSSGLPRSTRMPDARNAAGERRRGPAGLGTPAGQHSSMWYPVQWCLSPLTRPRMLPVCNGIVCSEFSPAASACPLPASSLPFMDGRFLSAASGSAAPCACACSQAANSAPQLRRAQQLQVQCATPEAAASGIAASFWPPCSRCSTMEEGSGACESLLLLLQGRSATRRCGSSLRACSTQGLACTCAGLTRSSTLTAARTRTDLGHTCKFGIRTRVGRDFQGRLSDWL